MAALSASRHNPIIPAFDQLLLLRGKVKMVDIIDSMRKLLDILNDTVRKGEA